MAKKIPLPYDASFKIDDAVMSVVDAISKIEPIRTGTQMTIFESKWRGSESILLLERAIAKLREIKIAPKPVTEESQENPK